MNSVIVFLACVAAASATVAYTVPQHQYYVPSSYSSQYQYVQHPSAVSGVKYVQPVVSGSTVQQYAVPSTSQYVYNSAVPSYYSSPVVSSYGYGVGAYPNYAYTYPTASYVYGK